MSEPDGADEIVGGGLRLAATAAALVGQRIAEARAEAARQAAEADAQQARQMGTRLTAERNAARAQYGVVDRDDWWRTAGAGDVADVWQTAQSWRDLDPEAGRALDRIRTQVRDRYGVDLDDGGEVDRDALERAVTERQAATVERRRAQQAGETLEAAVALATNDPNVAAVIDQDVRRAGLATELAELEKPIDLAAQVVAGLRQGTERDVTVAQAEFSRAKAAYGNHESAAARLLADAAPGGGEQRTDESLRRQRLAETMGYSPAQAREMADALNAYPVTAAPAAGKAALRAPKARKSPDRTAERSRGR